MNIELKYIIDLYTKKLAQHRLKMSFSTSGSGSYISGGYVYAPYIPVQFTKIDFEIKDCKIKEKKSVVKYSKTELKPEYFGKVKISS